MTQWRTKQMNLAEWTTFQEQFAELFPVLGGGNRLALFMRGHPADEAATILIAADKTQLLERLSPGGWADHPNPQAQQWTMLFGEGGAPSELGLTLGSDQD